MGVRRPSAGGPLSGRFPICPVSWHNSQWARTLDGNKDSRVELMDEKDTPSWFQYPAPFLRTVETGLARFRPWRILEGVYSTSRMAGLKERFPTRDLFPFVLRTDCDD